MRMHCIIHASFELAGYFEQWAVAENIEVSKTYLHKGQALPSLDSFDLLLSMGGPQSPLQTEEYPYLADEIAFMQQAVAAGKYIVGVCLGAQLIAESFGAQTERSPFKEIGFFPVHLTAAAKDDPMFQDFPDTFLSGHWHGDMPGLPPGAMVLAESAGCPRQIVRFTDKVYGFQCHLEFNEHCVRKLLAYCSEELLPGPYIQSANDMLGQDYPKINFHLKQFLQRLLQKKDSSC